MKVSYCGGWLFLFISALTITQPCRGIANLWKTTKAAVSSRIQNWLLKRLGLEDKLVILTTTTTSTNATVDSGNIDGKDVDESHHKKRRVLLIILPGSYTEPEEYLAVAKAVQKHAAGQLNLVIGIGLFLNPFASRWTRWALKNNNSDYLIQLVQTKATKQMMALEKTEASTNNNNKGENFENKKPKSFDSIFLWGHSMGGWTAMQAAYPYTITGLILYGCTLSCISNTSPMSYPKPVLTIMGERDGFMRYYQMAEEAQDLNLDLKRRLGALPDARTAPTLREDVTHLTHTRKPCMVVRDLNHMAMAMGVVPAITQKTGRSDFTSATTDLSHGHDTLGQVIVDFMVIHTTSATSRKNDSAAQERILARVRDTISTFMDPFTQLSDPVYQKKFLADIQRQLWYGKDNNNTSGDNSNSNNLPSIVVNWHTNAKDFLYSKSKHLSAYKQVWLEAVEQSNTISISSVPQISKTLAFKGKSRELIMDHSNVDDEKTAPTTTTTLMELNQQTFGHVLNAVVSPQQRERYLKEGKKLEFGPDIFVPIPPDWVETPLALTRNDDNNCHVLQSPYTKTDPSTPPPGDGVWYGKPLSPAQAYEWIVFDAYKP